MKYVIDRKRMPSYLPTNLTVILILCSKVYAWGPLANGIAFTLLGLIWLGALTAVYKEEKIDPFRGMEVGKHDPF